MATISQVSTNTDFSTVTGTKISGSSTGTTSSTTSAAADNAEKLKNQFLSILLTQMQHQNPLDPMDTKEFTGQLTQFSSLEQQIDTNTKLDNLIGSLTQNTVAGSFGYLGKTVELDSATTVLQEGAADWSYTLPSEAKTVKIEVKDADGTLVYSGNLQNEAGGNIAAGTYNLGLLSSDLSQTLANGSALTLSVTAENSAGDYITSDIHTTVQVESIQSDDETTYLQAGGLLFEATDIKKIIS